MWNKEKQDLLQARTRALRNAEEKIEQLKQENIAVHDENKDLRFEIEQLKQENIAVHDENKDLRFENEEQLKQENIAVHDENKDLRFENEEQKDVFKDIIKLTEINSYNNEKAILSKIKELAETGIQD